MTQNAKRLDNLDLMKTIAILLVISLHAALWKYEITNNFFSTPDIIQYSFRVLSQGVPIFLAVNGFLLFRKKKLDIKKHYLKTLKLLLLFVFWTALLYIIKEITNNNLNSISFTSVVNTIFEANSSNAVTWFLQSLIAVYLIYPMLKLLYDKEFLLFKILFVIVTIFTVCISILNLFKVSLDSLSLSSIAKEIGMTESFVIKFSPLANGWFLLFFMLGGMIYYNYEYFSRKRIFFILAGIISTSATIAFAIIMTLRTGIIYNPDFMYSTLFMPVCILGLWAITLKYKSKQLLINKLIRSFGKNTFGIYLTHWIFIYLLRYFYTPELFWHRLLFYISVVVLSYLFSLLLKIIPGVKHIVTV